MWLVRRQAQSDIRCGCGGLSLMHEDACEHSCSTFRPSRVEWIRRPKLAAAVRTGEAAASSIKAASTLAALTRGTMSALQTGAMLA